MSKLDLVVACTLAKRGIGFRGSLPWKLPKQMKFFSEITSQGPHKNSVILGRNTYESINRPLPRRHNIVVTSKPQLLPDSVFAVRSLDEAVHKAQELSPEGRTFVIGGAKLYEQAIPRARYIFETRVNKSIECDTFMPEHKFEAGFISKTMRENDINYDIVQYYNPKLITSKSFARDSIMPKERHQELQYIDMLKNIIDNGYVEEDRTGTGTKSLFGNMMRYDLSSSFPLLTTKRVFWKGVVEELLWFIRGSTNSNELRDKKVHIWDGNGSREYLDSIGLKHREQGDLGPVYGFQWRHWGAEYKDMHQDYSGKGIDQLRNLINDIKKNPKSRRLIMSAWNPSHLPEMALPPCHVMCHFHVSADNRLNCIMYQRSCDMGLGVPFNIASYALLTCMIAQICDLERGEFVHMMGNTHVYLNHIPKLQPELNRVPFPFPWLQLNKSIKDIDKFTLDDIQLKDYKSHGKISMEMAV